MIINISYLNADVALKENMFITAQPIYENRNIEFENLHKMVSSDFRQYSPFSFKDKTKKGVNWSNENQNILILDVDDGLTIDEAKLKFKAYKYFICTTKSHQKNKKGIVCDRFRIMLPIENNPVGDVYFDYMKVLEDMFSFIDKQVNTKSGAFLGSSNCKYWYNEGFIFDMDILKPIKIVKPIVETNFKTPTSHQNDLPIEDIKTKLTRECVADIIQSLGYEVNSKFMFKVRSENTPSCSISKDCIVMDFGGEKYGDVFNFLMIEKKMSFPESVNYVSGFTGNNAVIK